MQAHRERHNPSKGAPQVPHPVEGLPPQMSCWTPSLRLPHQMSCWPPLRPPLPLLPPPTSCQPHAQHHSPAAQPRPRPPGPQRKGLPQALSCARRPTCAWLAPAQLPWTHRPHASGALRPAAGRCPVCTRLRSRLRPARLHAQVDLCLQAPNQSGLSTQGHAQCAQQAHEHPPHLHYAGTAGAGREWLIILPHSPD